MGDREKEASVFDAFLDSGDERYEGARDTDEGIIISTEPDYCYSPDKIVPYTIFAKQSDDAGTAATVRMTGKRSHTSASLITTCYGNEAGSGGGVDSGTHKGVCRPKTWSSKVFIEGKPAVRDSDEWFMNNGNTVGLLNFKIPPQDKKPPSSDEADEGIDPMTTGATHVSAVTSAPPLDGYGNLQGAIEYDKILKRGQNLLREVGSNPLIDLGKAAKFATGTGAFLGTFFAMEPSYRGAFADQWVSHRGQDPSLDVLYDAALAQWDEIGQKRLPISGEQWLARWNSVLTEYQTRALAGELGPTNQTIAEAAAVGALPPEMKERLNRDRVVVTGAALTAVMKTCLEFACPAVTVGLYRGGAHWCTSQPTFDNLDSHHMPAQGYGNTFPPLLGPAIQMVPEDHKMTASNPSSRKLGKDYNRQAAHLAVGQNFAAFKLDVDDIEDVEQKIGQPGKYAAAVAQAAAYMKCLKENNLVQ